MKTLLQISDPHFGTERPPVVAALRALCREIEPAVVVVSGDITQRARRKQFTAARAFVDALGASHVLAVPGNHDVPLFDFFTRLVAPYREHRRAFGTELEPELDADDLLVLCVNTTRAYRHKHGEVSAAQIERVAGKLRAARPEQLRVVVTHQPAAVFRRQDAHNRLRGGEHAVRAWAAAGADLVLGGHIHFPYLLAMHEQLEALERRLWVVNAGTATSSRVRHEADNSVNCIRYAALEARVQRWDYGEVSQRFELVSELRLDLERPPVG
jgi:3',5'-cyclic AMP phosphodiesterase CpdA